MAVIVGQYIVTGNNRSAADYALGITYPYSMTGNTFNLAYDNIINLKTKLKHVLSTRRGEIINQPLFGTDLHRFIFEPQDEKLNEKIFAEIERAVNIWVPEVIINDIEISSTQDMLDMGQTEVLVTFKANDNRFFGVNFNVRA